MVGRQSPAWLRLKPWLSAIACLHLWGRGLPCGCTSDGPENGCQLSAVNVFSFLLVWTEGRCQAPLCFPGVGRGRSALVHSWGVSWLSRGPLHILDVSSLSDIQITGNSPRLWACLFIFLTSLDKQTCLIVIISFIITCSGFCFFVI